MDKIDLHESAWVHDTALLYGHIRMGAESSVWPNVVMRSEL
ncbi:MAG: gamma carbonic anhydrase family protein, partial [Rhodobiaceae bacterium]|nr:gamma carbonic anhydrase family protein [Rhodobiaceae bacterium]